MTSRSRAAALLVAVFLVGLLTGAGATAFADRHDGRGGHRKGSRGYLERLREDLDLTSVQQDSVRAVLERYEPSFDSLWRETRPRFETLRAGIRSEIRTHLTPEQRTEYDALVERHRRRPPASR